MSFADSIFWILHFAFTLMPRKLVLDFPSSQLSSLIKKERKREERRGEKREHFASDPNMRKGAFESKMVMSTKLTH